MILTAGWNLLKLSLAEPARAIGQLQSLGLDVGQRWMLLALAAVLSTLLALAAEALFPIEAVGPMALLREAPVALVGVQLGAAAVAAGLITVVGRAFGGQGSFDDALLMVAWVESVVVALQVIQLVLMTVFPATAAMLTLVAFALYVILMVRLTTALHGFANPFVVGVAMVATLLLAGMVMSIVLSAIGFAPPLPESGS